MSGPNGIGNLRSADSPDILGQCLRDQLRFIGLRARFACQAAGSPVSHGNPIKPSRKTMNATAARMGEAFPSSGHSQHANIAQPLFKMLRPAAGDRILGRSHPKGMAAFGINPQVDAHPDILECEHVGQGMADIGASDPVRLRRRGRTQAKRRAPRQTIDSRRSSPSLRTAERRPRLDYVVDGGFTEV